MSLTFGVAIPCYFKHIEYIPSLLENIASSTVKPDQIVISCSSWVHNKTEYFVYENIPVQIWYSSQKLNQATNRNRAASLLMTSLISFIDADDLMHPRRIEFIKQTFENRPDISVVYHDYTYDHISKRNDPFWEEPEALPLSNPIVKDPNAVGVMVLTDPPNQYSHHHAHVTIRRVVFAKFKFNESWQYYRMEDSVYGAVLIGYGIPAVYLRNKLTRYIFNN